MKNVHRMTMAVVGVAVLALGSACATVAPPREIETARVALQDARDAGAERVSTRQFDEAARKLALAERTWQEKQDKAMAAHQANLAEAAAREVQAQARMLEAEAALARNRERQVRAATAVKDAEMTLLTMQTALREAERRTAELEARAEAARKALAARMAALEQELERREAELRATTEQTAAEREKSAAQQAAEREKSAAERARLAAERKAEREKAAAAVASLRNELTRARADAEMAAKAAEAERERLAEQRRANEARAAELARLQLQREQLEQQQAESQKKLSSTLAELAEVREEARGLIISLPGSIYFDFDKAKVRDEMQGRLTEIAKALKEVDGRVLLIEGHTDSDGASDYNMKLSERRAEAVRSILVDAGIAGDRVRAVGYGETRPRVANSTAAAKAQNRRVEIVLEQANRTATQ